MVFWCIIGRMQPKLYFLVVSSFSLKRRYERQILVQNPCVCRARTPISVEVLRPSLSTPVFFFLQDSCRISVRCLGFAKILLKNCFVERRLSVDFFQCLSITSAMLNRLVRIVSPEKRSPPTAHARIRERATASERERESNGTGNATIIHSRARASKRWHSRRDNVKRNN